MYEQFHENVQYSKLFAKDVFKLEILNFLKNIKLPTQFNTRKRGSFFYIIEGNIYFHILLTGSEGHFVPCQLPIMEDSRGPLILLDLSFRFFLAFIFNILAT